MKTLNPKKQEWITLLELQVNYSKIDQVKPPNLQNMQNQFCKYFRSNRLVTLPKSSTGKALTVTDDDFFTIHFIQILNVCWTVQWLHVRNNASNSDHCTSEHSKFFQRFLSSKTQVGLRSQSPILFTPPNFTSLYLFIDNVDFCSFPRSTYRFITASNNLPCHILEFCFPSPKTRKHESNGPVWTGHKLDKNLFETKF